MFGFTQSAAKQLVDAEKIEGAIARAESRTSGEICVSFAPFFWGSVEKAAQRTFERMGVSATRERNGVLLFVVPSRRRLVIIGDDGIHAKVGQVFWQRVLKAATGAFAFGDFTGGLVRAVEIVGEALATHFPRRPDDVDELPNRVDLERGEKRPPA